MQISKSYARGVKQATSVFVPVYFIIYVMGYYNKKETKFLESRSKYAVSNDLYFTVSSNKLTFDVDRTNEFHYIMFEWGLQHITTLKQMTQYSPKTQTTNG